MCVRTGLGKRKNNCSHGKSWENIMNKNVSMLVIKTRIGMGLILKTVTPLAGREGIDKVFR